jgi:hypothetical protein
VVARIYGPLWEGKMSDAVLPQRGNLSGDGDAIAQASSKNAQRPAFLPTKNSLWEAWKGNIGADIKNISFAGLLVTAMVAYFQNLSTYQDKVATLAKDDMQAATTTFADASNKLSTALSLQQRLVWDFYDAKPNEIYKDDTAYLTKDARETYKGYAAAYTALRDDYNLLARKAEIYLDWASDKSRDPASNAAVGIDPITVSMLGAVDFNCEKHMPDRANSRITVKKDNNALQVDWNSAKHHVLTIEYCFEVTHRRMTAALQWASASPIAPAEMDYMTRERHLFFDERPTTQILRLNAFMSLAMSEIEQIRVKYRPTGFLCNLPGVREVLGQRCTPIRVAG